MYKAQKALRTLDNIKATNGIMRYKQGWGVGVRCWQRVGGRAQIKIYELEPEQELSCKFRAYGYLRGSS